MKRAPVITVIGKSARNPADPVPERALRAAEEVGKLLAQRGAVVVTGGLSGVMEAVSRGAKTAGGLVIGILPGFDKREANAYVDVAITTGMGWMRNTLVVRAADLEGTGGWSDRIRDIAYKGKHLDEGGTSELRFATTPAEAVDLALSLAPGAETGKNAEREFRS
jgi:hypothetical protein